MVWIWYQHYWYVILYLAASCCRHNLQPRSQDEGMPGQRYRIRPLDIVSESFVFKGDILQVESSSNMFYISEKNTPWKGRYIAFPIHFPSWYFGAKTLKRHDLSQAMVHYDCLCQCMAEKTHLVIHYEFCTNSSPWVIKSSSVSSSITHV